MKQGEKAYWYGITWHVCLSVLTGSTLIKSAKYVITLLCNWILVEWLMLRFTLNIHLTCFLNHIIKTYKHRSKCVVLVHIHFTKMYHFLKYVKKIYVRWMPIPCAITLMIYWFNWQSRTKICNTDPVTLIVILKLKVHHLPCSPCQLNQL